METIIKWIMYAYAFTIGFPYYFIKGFVRGWRGEELKHILPTPRVQLSQQM